MEENKGKRFSVTCVGYGEENGKLFRDTVFKYKDDKPYAKFGVWGTGPGENKSVENEESSMENLLELGRRIMMRNKKNERKYLFLRNKYGDGENLHWVWQIYGGNLKESDECLCTRFPPDIIYSCGTCDHVDKSGSCKTCGETNWKCLGHHFW